MHDMPFPKKKIWEESGPDPTLLSLKTKMSKELSGRKETVRLLYGSVFAKCNWETIFCGRYRSIFNYCDVIGLQSYRIQSNNTK